MTRGFGAGGIALIMALAVLGISPVGASDPGAQLFRAPVTEVSFSWIQQESTIRRGDGGPTVAEWQGLLNEWLTVERPGEDFRLAIDGSFGRLTDAVTRALQAAQGLPVDGIVGPITRAAFVSAPKLANGEPDPAADDDFLARGDTGPRVADWQEQLNRWLNATMSSEERLVVDGVFGDQTEATTRQFQAAEEITVDGLVGAETLAAMLSSPPIANRVPGQVIPTLEPGPKAPADAPYPAAGVCSQVSSDVVTIIVAVDVPRPRCVLVAAQQRLRLLNDTDSSVEVRLGPFSTELAAGETTIFDRPLGEYLESGVHVVEISRYGGSGAELWLRDETD